MLNKNAGQESILSPDLVEVLHKKYPNLFHGRHGAEGLLKVVILCAVGGTGVIATGILALRTGTEGTLPGIAFGGFAFALGLASLINAWDVSDEIGEMLDNLVKDRDQNRKHAQIAREAPVIRQFEGARQEAVNIRAHNQAQGEAAAAAVRRLKFQALTRSAGVVGHGRIIAPPASGTDVSPPEMVEEPAVSVPTRNGHHPDRAVPAPAIPFREQ